ncbi:MAG: glycine cleavage system protein T, partial [Alphaproteobacteria bacterium]
MAGTAAPTEPLKQTALHALHVELGARMVPFAGYDMPVQYPDGIIAEHRHARAAAGLFDVSHMGQARLVGDDPAAALERLVPGDIAGLDAGAMRYTLLLNDEGGIIDDLMVTRPAGLPGALQLVVNAACKDGDFAHIEAALAGAAMLERDEDRALLALQGPQAAAVLARLAPDCLRLSFMHGVAMVVDGHDCFVTRSGYTGEDGFEISVANDGAEALARRLLDEAEVAPIG